MYKLLQDTKYILRYDENTTTTIPVDDNNIEYQAYLKWLDGYEWKMIEPMKMEWVKVAESNEPEPADEVTP